MVKRSRALPPRATPFGEGPKPMYSEAELLRQCRLLLDACKDIGLLTYRRIHVMPVRVAKGRLRVNHDMQGMADILVFLKNKAATTLHIELKRPRGKSSASQIKWREELRALGHLYLVVESVAHLEQILERFGVGHFTFGGNSEGTANRLSGGIVHDK